MKNDPWCPQTLEAWFFRIASLTAEQLDYRKPLKDAACEGYSYGYFNNPFIGKGKPKVFEVTDRRLAPVIRELFKLMSIKYITARAGEEANYIVFLDQQMNKFAEVYLAK